MSGSEDAGQHKCVFCSQAFTSRAHLQAHFRQHANGDIDIKGHPKGKAKAVVANRDEGGSSSTPSSTSGSSTAGKKTDAAQCDVCGERFRTVSLAISHKFRKHPESAQKHYCPHCGMMFPIKINRDKHLLTHCGPVPKKLFPCLTCSVAFYSQHAINFHRQSAHKGANQLANPILTPAPSMKIVLNNAGEAQSVYYCHLCGCEYQVKYNLQKHLATKHSSQERQATPEEVVKCTVCSAMFYSKRAYETHNHHHREGDMFATNEELRQQVVQRVDQDFDHRRVPTTAERFISASALTSLRSHASRNFHERHKICHGKEEEEEEEEEEKEGEGEGEGEDSLSASEKLAELPTAVTENKARAVGWQEDVESPVQRRENTIRKEDDGSGKTLTTTHPNTSAREGDNDGQVSQVTENGVEPMPGAESRHTVRGRQSRHNKGCQQRPGQPGGGGVPEELQVAKIVGMREGQQGREFLVRWRGFEPADDTWEQEQFLRCPTIIQDFLNSSKGRAGQQPIEWYEEPTHKRRRGVKKKQEST